MIGPVDRAEAVRRARESAELAIRAARRARLTLPHVPDEPYRASVGDVREVALEVAADALRWLALAIPEPRAVQLHAGPHPRQAHAVYSAIHASRIDAARLAAELRAERAMEV